MFLQRKRLAVTALNEKRRESWKPLHFCFRIRLEARQYQKIQRVSSYLSDSTLLWSEEPSIRVQESSKQRSCSKEFSKRSLGHPLVEARCDGFPKKELQSVRTSDEFWWLQKCFRSSHRQGCSPHSSLRESKKFPDFEIIHRRLYNQHDLGRDNSKRFGE